MSRQDAISLNIIWDQLRRAESNANTMRYREKDTFEKFQYAIFAQVYAERALAASNTPKDTAEKAEVVILETNQVISEDKNLIASTERLIEDMNDAISYAQAVINKATSIQNTPRRADTSSA